MTAHRINERKESIEKAQIDLPIVGFLKGYESPVLRKLYDTAHSQGRAEAIEEAEKVVTSYTPRPRFDDTCCGGAVDGTLDCIVDDFETLKKGPRQEAVK